MTLDGHGADEAARSAGAKDPHDAHDPRVAAANRRIANALVMRRIQTWLARDAADRALQARVWRLAWVFLGLCVLTALYYLVRLT